MPTNAQCQLWESWPAVGEELHLPRIQLGERNSRKFKHSRPHLYSALGCDDPGAEVVSLPLQQNWRDSEGPLEILQPRARHAFVGKRIYYNFWFYWSVVDANADFTFECLHPFTNEKVRLSRAHVEAGLRKVFENEVFNLASVQAKLPRWAFQEEAARASEYLATSVGPVVPWVRAAAVAVALTQIGVFISVRSATACAETGSQHGLTFAVLVGLLTFFGRMVAECHALSYALPTFAKLCDFTIFGNRVPFCLWLSLSWVFSQLNLLDTITDSLVAGSSMQMLHCHAAVETIWKQTWQQSMFGSIPLPNLSSVIGCSWVLSLVQVLVPLMRTTHMSDVTGKALYELRESGRRLTPCTHENLYHSNILNTLADAAGMASLQGMAIPWTYNWLANPPHHTGTPAFQLLSCKKLADQLLERVFLSYILENCVQLQIQGTIYASRIAMCKIRGDVSHHQATAALSIMVGCLTTILKLSEAAEFAKVMSEAKRIVNQDDACDEAKRHFHFTRTKCYLIGLGCLVLLLSAVYALAQVAMAHVCPDAIWHLTGCVNVRDHVFLAAEVP